MLKRRFINQMCSNRAIRNTLVIISPVLYQSLVVQGLCVCVCVCVCVLACFSVHGSEVLLIHNSQFCCCSCHGKVCVCMLVIAF